MERDHLNEQVDTLTSEKDLAVSGNIKHHVLSITEKVKYKNKGETKI